MTQMDLRPATTTELDILSALVANAGAPLNSDGLEGLLVAYMDAAHSGSLYLFPRGVPMGERVYGRDISQIVFPDSDGIEVVATLSVDEQEQLLELDIWKWDMSSFKGTKLTGH